jgi:hypothetical protein
MPKSRIRLALVAAELWARVVDVEPDDLKRVSVMRALSMKRSPGSFFTLVVAIALAYGTLDATSAKAAPAGATKLGKSALKYNTGTNNTAIGFFTLNPNFFCTDVGMPNACCTGAQKGICGNSAANNTAVGAVALASNTTGGGHAAVGDFALASNTTGTENSALGSSALVLNTTGSGNVAVGYQSLAANTADHNVAVGYGSLRNNSTGATNTGLGDLALYTNTTGNGCTAVGYQALLFSNNNDNTAVGNASLRSTTTGNNNTALGRATLPINTTGAGNTALGVNSLFNNTTGAGNIAVGQFAGFNLTTGDNNIDIGHNGVAAESNTIRIGVNHVATYIAGISGATSAGGVAVFVDGAGHLGTITSSARFKEDIQDIGDSSSALMKLRPVRFHYKHDVDPSGLEQYGLVAEEVAKVYPDLVVYDDNGQPETVRYHFVNALLLNEVQRQARRAEAQERESKRSAARSNRSAVTWRRSSVRTRRSPRRCGASAVRRGRSSP